MDPRYYLGLAVGVVMGWFAFGVIFNLRRGDTVLRWMRQGLPRIGERTTFRWLGTSVAELVIGQARKPIRRLETLVVLVPRDVPWLWAWAALRGRRDTLILRGQLQAPPRIDLELADPATWTGRMGLQQVEMRGWERAPYHDLQLMAPRGMLELARETLDRLSEPAAELTPRYRRLALRRDAPHFELHMALPETQHVDANEFFEALRGLGRAISQSD